jgi:hypothetical protein
MWRYSNGAADCSCGACPRSGGGINQPPIELDADFPEQSFARDNRPAEPVATDSNRRCRRGG